MSPDQTHLALLSEDIRRVPDELFAVQLDLQPLCRSDAAHISEADKATVAAVCARLHSVIGDLSEIVKQIDAWQAMDGAAWNVNPDTNARSTALRPDSGIGED